MNFLTSLQVRGRGRNQTLWCEVCGKHKAHDPAKWVKSASFETRQDQLCVEGEAHVEQRSSPLVGGIEASIIITRAMPGTSAGSPIWHYTNKTEIIFKMWNRIFCLQWFLTLAWYKQFSTRPEKGCYRSPDMSSFTREQEATRSLAFTNMKLACGGMEALQTLVINRQCLKQFVSGT